MATTLATPAVDEAKLLNSEEFLDWLQPGVLADLIRGKIVMRSPVNLRHARLVNFMDHLLRSYLEAEDLGELHRETVAIRLSIRDTFLPDLAYFTKAQAARLSGTHAQFAPAFILEALSPSTAQNDTGPKFAAYELHGVQEYWILGPENLQHHFYRREGDMFNEFAIGFERVESNSIRGFWIERAWLNPGRLPPVSRCLAQLRAGSKPRRRRT
jgi:Uma2 family endonuclease